MVETNSKELLEQITKLTKTVEEVKNENVELKNYVNELIKKMDQHLLKTTNNPTQPTQ